MDLNTVEATLTKLESSYARANEILTRIEKSGHGTPPEKRTKQVIWREICAQAEQTLAKAEGQTKEQRIDKYLQTEEGRGLYSELLEALEDPADSYDQKSKSVAKQDTPPSLRARIDQRIDEIQKAIQEKNPNATQAKVSDMLWADPVFKALYRHYSDQHSDKPWHVAVDSIRKRDGYIDPVFLVRL